MHWVPVPWARAMTLWFQNLKPSDQQRQRQGNKSNSLPGQANHDLHLLNLPVTVNHAL
jgi:hypothetical protein